MSPVPRPEPIGGRTDRYSSATGGSEAQELAETLAGADEPPDPGRLGRAGCSLIRRKSSGPDVFAEDAVGTRAAMAHVLINRLIAKPGQRDSIVRNLLASGQRFDDNPACLLYLVTESTDSTDEIWVVDLWTTAEEHAMALQAPELKPFIEQTIPLLEGMPQQIGVRARGGKGLPD